MKLHRMFNKKSAMLLALPAALMAYAGAADAAAYHTLHAVSGSGLEGSRLESLVIGADGSYYGVAPWGGINSYSSGGVVFKMTTGNQYTVLHNFSSTDQSGVSPDGTSPSTLIAGADGNFYGTTYYGGAGTVGTVFKITSDGTLTTLHDFSTPDENYNNTDGMNPGYLVRTSDGSLYGATQSGGANGRGTLFRIAADGSFSVLHSFDTTESYGVASLVVGSDGKVYGLLSYGGANSAGSFFRLEADGTLTTLHSFPAYGSGVTALVGPYLLHAASNGVFYGATYSGGAYNDGGIFKLTLDGTETDLHSFPQRTRQGVNLEGAQTAKILEGADGNLYGVATSGGGGKHGTVFKLAPDGSTFTLLYTFSPFSLNEGQGPTDLVQNASGDLVGVTTSGGNLYSAGTLFKIAMNDPLSVQLSLDQSTIVSGSNVTATWSSAGATSCVTFGGVLGKSFGRKPASGTLTMAPFLRGNYVSTLQCTDGNGGLADASVMITVTPQPTPPPPAASAKSRKN